MVDERATLSGPTSRPEDRLDGMPKADFVAAWEALVGEPPAAMLESRSEMIRILVESTPVAEASGAFVPIVSVLPRHAQSASSSYPHPAQLPEVPPVDK